MNSNQRYAEKCMRIAEALRRGCDWVYLSDEYRTKDRIAVIDGHYIMTARAKSVAEELGWNSPLIVNRDTMIGLTEKEPLMTMPFGSQIEGGNLSKMRVALLKDISYAFKDSYERTVDKTFGRVRFVYADGIHGSRTYRHTGKGVLVFDVAGEGDVPVGPEIYFHFGEPVDLPAMFAKAEARLQQSLHDKSIATQA